MSAPALTAVTFDGALGGAGVAIGPRQSPHPNWFCDRMRYAWRPAGGVSWKLPLAAAGVETVVQFTHVPDGASQSPRWSSEEVTPIEGMTFHVIVAPGLALATVKVGANGVWAPPQSYTSVSVTWPMETCSFESTWLINKTEHLRLVTSEHSSRVFDNGGMCGGYPAPTCQKHRAVRDSNVFELAADGRPLAHAPGKNPHHSDFEMRFEGEFELVEGPYITAPHKSGDIFSHSYNGGGGYGDVLERDPVKTAWDVENGFLTSEAAANVFGIVLAEDEDGYPAADLDATERLRRRKRAERLEKAVPVSEWMARERGRVKAADFAPEVRKMYASAMKLSAKFTREFNEFWGVDGETVFAKDAK